MSLLNENIRFLRQKQGFKSARKFAEYLNEKPGRVSDYETRRQPSKEFLAKIAHKFDLDLSLFISEKITEQNYSRLFAEKTNRTAEAQGDYNKEDDFFDLAQRIKEENDAAIREVLIQRIIKIHASKLEAVDKLKDEIMKQLKEKEDLLKRL